MRTIAAFLLGAGALAVAAAPASAATRVITPTTLTIYVGKHGVAGGPKKFTVRKNARVALIVHSVIGEAVHLHGYNIEKPIRSKTIPVRIAFVAKVTGVFEIELHLPGGRGLRIGLLTVK
jgi:hypothetical protein